MHEPERRGEYRKAADEEDQLSRMNERFAPLEKQLISGFDRPRQPMVWIVGVPRSGTTLLSQLLARTGGFSYITNFAARFWMAPYLGTTIQHSLGLDSDPSELPLGSKLGVTPTWCGPHEFGYFWGRWFPFEDTHKLTEQQLAGIDSATLSAELAAVESVTDRPLFIKNLTCGLQLSWLTELFANSLFVLVRRDPVYNCQSLLRARQDIYGDPSIWWSLRPQEYLSLVSQTPHLQVAGQIHYLLQDLLQSLRQLPQENWMQIRYEDLCQRPQESLRTINQGYEQLGGTLDMNFQNLPEQLGAQNRQQVDSPQWDQINAATEQFFGGGASESPH